MAGQWLYSVKMPSAIPTKVPIIASRGRTIGRRIITLLADQCQIIAVNKLCFDNTQCSMLITGRYQNCQKKYENIYIDAAIGRRCVSGNFSGAACRITLFGDNVLADYFHFVCIGGCRMYIWSANRDFNQYLSISKIRIIDIEN